LRNNKGQKKSNSYICSKKIQQQEDEENRWEILQSVCKHLFQKFMNIARAQQKQR